jgi:hypothetical protein
MNVRHAEDIISAAEFKEGSASDGGQSFRHVLFSASGMGLKSLDASLKQAFLLLGINDT